MTKKSKQELAAENADLLIENRELRKRLQIAEAKERDLHKRIEDVLRRFEEYGKKVAPQLVPWPVPTPYPVVPKMPHDPYPGYPQPWRIYCSDNDNVLENDPGRRALMDRHPSARPRG